MLSPGERMQALRKEKNLTQDQLSQILNCSKQSIYRYENNQTQMDTHTLIKAAHFFEVTSDYLLGISRQKNGKDYNHITFYDEVYFWINKDRENFGGYTQWASFTVDGKEKRVLRPVIPEKALEICKELYGSPLIIHTEQDVRTFLISGGNALIRESICRKYLPKFLVPFIQ